ncbi:MAG: glycosyltransferase [Magnetococcales bacterium]|nr:glycosyltransferase [Magnetococcales bacterium]MBF0321828.1 glycosyltransferase [Magnetococcales bacterium]
MLAATRGSGARNMVEVTIILPTFNEVLNVRPLIEELEVAVAGWSFEILVVDDDSPDGTSREVEKLTEKFANLRLIVRRSDHGLVPSLRDGIRAARGNIVVWMDADQSMRPAEVPQLLDAIRHGHDLAFGSRYVLGGSMKGGGEQVGWRGVVQTLRNIQRSQDSFWSVFVSLVGNMVVRFALDRRFYDYTSGFYAVRKEVFNTIHLEGRYLDYCISLLYKTSVHGFRIAELPSIVLVRQLGESKTSSGLFDLFPLIFQCFKMVRSLRRYGRAVSYDK